jgi:hypothetical protein
MRKLLSTILILALLSSCSKEMYFNKTAAQVTKSTLQVQEKTSSGSGYIFKTQNNEVVFMQSTTEDKSKFDKVVVVAFEKDVNIPIKSEDIDYADAIYFKDKRSLVIHSKKDNMVYLFGLDEKQSLEKIDLLKQNTNFKTNEFKSVLGYGISVLSGNWDLQKFLNTATTSAFDGLVASSKTINNNKVAPLRDECTSGGVGASECSIGSWSEMSCSVTCNAGYYACCKSSTTTCKCIKIPPQP